MAVHGYKYPYNEGANGQTDKIMKQRSDFKDQILAK